MYPIDSVSLETLMQTLVPLPYTLCKHTLLIAFCSLSLSVSWWVRPVSQYPSLTPSLPLGSWCTWGVKELGKPWVHTPSSTGVNFTGKVLGGE